MTTPATPGDIWKAHMSQLFEQQRVLAKEYAGKLFTSPPWIDSLSIIEAACVGFRTSFRAELKKRGVKRGEGAWGYLRVMAEVNQPSGDKDEGLAHDHARP